MLDMDPNVRAILGSLAMRDRGSRKRGITKAAVEKIVEEAVSNIVTGYPEYEDSRTTLAGTAETISAEDAWTTIASGAPAGARFAIIQFRGEGSTTVGSGAMQFRKESGAQEITAFEYPAGNNDESIHIATVFVEITGTGDFDYIANTTGTAYIWKIYRLGFW